MQEHCLGIWICIGTLLCTHSCTDLAHLSRPVHCTGATLVAKGANFQSCVCMQNGTCASGMVLSVLLKSNLFLLQADSSESSAAASTAPKTPMSYADLLRQRDSSNAQPVNRPSTPSQANSSATASAQPPAPSAPSTTVALPQRPSGSRWG